MPPVGYRGTLEDRFESRVNVKGAYDCWEWLGDRHSAGYGRISLMGKPLYAHRLAFEWASGIALRSCDFVMHLCDNPACVNPNHLELGDALLNSQDMYQKGRNIDVRGERNGKSKLNTEQVREIKRLIKEEKVSKRGIARLFGISPGAVFEIANGNTWKHVAAA